MDGTCLILYSLKDHNGNIIEIIPKTRGRVVADRDFIELLNKIDQTSINEYYSKNDGILMFELYGKLNPHFIQYGEDIDVKLIAVYENSQFTPTNPIFEKPDLVFSLEYDGNWIINVRSKRDAINGMYQLLIDLNEKHEKLVGKKAIEGVIINTLNINGHPKWIKIKPGMGNKDKVIMESSIKKEVLKYFDEYGSEVLTLYNNNENHHTEYIYQMLEEEFSRKVIDEYADKIEEIFMEFWNKRVHENINTISDDLIDEYANWGIDYCMNVFDKKYPMKRDESDKLYALLEEW